MKRKDSRKSNFERKLSSYALAGAALVVVPGAAHAGTITVVPVGETFTEGGSPDSYTLTFPSSSDTVTITAQPNTTFGSDPTNDVDASTGMNALILNNSGNSVPAALTLGALIDPTVTTNWGSGGKMASYDLTGPFSGGNWSFGGYPAYLGFYYTAPDGNHAGWAYISTTANASFSSFFLDEYGYDTTPNEAITAGEGQTPEPSTMTLIALGGAGLIALRRRRAKNA